MNNIFKLNFKFKIMVTMAAVLLLVIITGGYAYMQFSAIVTSITEKSKPDLYLVTAKSLINRVNDAENNVKSYRLTEDTSYVRKFYDAVQLAEDQLLVLRQIDPDNKRFSLMDSFTQLIEDKFIVLDELLRANTLFRVQEALTKVAGSIENVKETETSNSTNPIKELAFVKKLFKRKNEQKQEEAQVDLAEVNKELKQVQREEQNIEARIKQKELALIEQDKKMRAQLSAMVSKLEEQELNNLEMRKQEANEAMRKTNIQLALFCIAIGILLLVISYIIISYIRHNNHYRKVLKKAKHEAENLAETKERFLANVSHEIRTPMHAIAGFTEQLSNTKLNRQQRDQIDVIQKSIEHLLYLVNDVLDYSKLQAGKLQLENIAYRPSELLKEVIDLVDPLAKKKNIFLTKELNMHPDTILKGDSFRLRQILLNLMTNAIKFTDSGIISLKIGKIDQHKLRFDVTDSGKGMTSDTLSRIFNEFEQADAAVARGHGGTGLGLSIVKKLIEIQGGEIEIKSKINEGTSVTFTLPLVEGSAYELDQQHAQSKKIGKLPNQLKVLIVDDEEYNRKLINAILSKHGTSNMEAEDGNKAVALFEQNKFDIILMDSHMPELNGIEATKAIRTSNKEIPIIALTAATSESNKKKYKTVGMDGFLSKPFKESELINEMMRVLSKNNMVIEEAEDTYVEGKLIDFDELRSLSNGSSEFYNDMLETFIAGSEDGFKKIQELRNNQNWFMVAEYAHKMCSPCRHLSAMALYDKLKSIEHSCREETNLDKIDVFIESAKTEYEKIKVIINEELQEAN